MQETESNQTLLPKTTLCHFIFQGVVALCLMLLAVMTAEKIVTYMIVATGSMISVAAMQLLNKRAAVNFFLLLLMACYCYFYVTDISWLSFIWCLCVIPTIIGLGNFKQAVIFSALLTVINGIILSGLLHNTATTVVFSLPQLWVISTIILTTSLLSSYHLHNRGKTQATPLTAAHFTESKDKLTSLFLRTYMETYIEERLSSLSGSSDGVCVILLDLDNFRTLNERYGYDSGNRALQSIGAVIKKSLDKDYVIGRWDGNAFVIVSPHGDNQAGLLVAELLRQKISGLKLNVKGDRVDLTCTLGIASCAEFTNANELLLDVENKLYRGKKFGGDICVSN